MRKRLHTCFYVLILLLTANWVSAQCEFNGQVVEPFNDPLCGKLILSYDTWQLLVPTNESMLEGIAANDEIEFSFEPDGTQTSACTAGSHIELTCVNLISPPADCIADFSYSASFNEPTPVAAFEPAVLSDDFAYHWDFGDGNTSTEQSAIHTFPFQDIYEVCLTIESTDCGQLVRCRTIDLHECHSAFAYVAENGTVELTNLSTGNFSDWEWDMGNGTVMQNTGMPSYDYGEINIFTVCLTVWNNSGCSHQFCDYVYTGSGDICDFAECVYPGDTNDDGLANVYDLLPIGVGYGAEGPPRQVDDVSFALDWSPQFAPDWGAQTISGNDYKHLDCNGDGEIDSDDIAAIEANYATPNSAFMVQAPGSPTFWLDFEWDTIVIDDNTPALIELEADLIAGRSDRPMQDLNGFALQLDYDEEMVATDGIEVDYNDNSFFGNSNDIMWIGKNRQEDNGEYDLGFTRKSIEANGFGRVATLKFIIIGDVIARNAETSFVVTMDDVVAVNEEGALLTIGELLPASVHVIDKTTTTSTGEEWLNQQVLVYPNPASEQVSIRLNDLRAESVQAFNALGQLITDLPVNAGAFDLNVTNWDRGIYLLKIKTEKGVATKRVIVQ
ncbi:MAG: PKD domain-containing protein [Bacteroidota bacterium]